MADATCWVTYSMYYATGEGMHYRIAVARTAERARQLFDDRADKRFPVEVKTAMLMEAIRDFPDLQSAIPPTILTRAMVPLCWQLEFFGEIDFNCA